MSTSTVRFPCGCSVVDGRYSWCHEHLRPAKPTRTAMPRARHEDGLYKIPGGELLWVELDGRTFGVHSREAYLHVDGALEPGRLESWIRTDIRFTRFPEDGDTYEARLRVRPLVCEDCGDTGEGADYTTWGTTECPSCGGLGDELNLRTCTWCGGVQYFPEPVLPCAPREVQNHDLLLARMHPDCAIAATVAHVRATEPAMVGRGARVKGVQMKCLVLVLSLGIGLVAVADDVIDCAPGSGMHFNGAEMLCDVPLVPRHRALPSVSTPAQAPAPCSPSTPPGAVCVWPQARTLELLDPSGRVARVVALVEGPVLIPLRPTASRFGTLFTVGEWWLDCPSVFQFSGTFSLTSDVWCAVP